MNIRPAIFLSRCVCAALGLYGLLPPAASARQLTVPQGNRTSAAASRVVPILIDDAAGLASVALRMNYDPLLVSVVAVTNPAGSVGAGFYMDYKVEDGTIDIVMTKANPLASGSGVLATVEFRALSGAEIGSACDLPLAKVSLGGDYGRELSWGETILTSPGRICVVSPYNLDYSGWALQIPGAATNDHESALNDGYANLLKYATGSSPTNTDSLAQLTAGLANGAFSFAFMRNTNAVDVTLIVEGSDRLDEEAPWMGLATNSAGSWGGAANIVEVGGNSPVAVRVDRGAPAFTNQFLRLRVTRP